MSVARIKSDSQIDSKSMKNREECLVKSPDLKEAFQKLRDKSTPNDGNSSTSDNDSVRDDASLTGGDAISDGGHAGSGGSVSTRGSKCGKNKMDKLYSDRMSALDELLSTEKLYIDDLEQIIQEYMELMKKNEPPKPQTLLGKETTVFGNLQQIYEWHKNTFLPEMEKYIDNPQKLGTIFTKYVRRLTMYSKYCENKPRSEDIVAENLDYFEQLRVILDQKLHLADMLIKPVQRIMKYELLLKAIMKYTERVGEDIKSIQRAAEVMCQVPKAANDMMNAGRLRGFEGNITNQGRLFLQDSMAVAEQTSSKVTLERISYKERKAFLFEQIIIFSKVAKNSGKTGLRYLYCGSIRVNKMMLTELLNDPRCFRLIDKTPGAAVQYLCQCPDESIQKNWVYQIKLLLNNQTDFLKALQSPINYQTECARINSGDTNAVTNESESKDSAAEKAPKTSKKNKSSRSFKNLFIKTQHHDNQDPKTPKLRGTVDSPAPQTARKLSLSVFESFSGHKTADANADQRPKWSTVFTSLARRKNSDASSTSPSSVDENHLTVPSKESRRKKTHHVSYENILINSKGEPEVRLNENATEDDREDFRPPPSKALTPQPKSDERRSTRWNNNKFFRLPNPFMVKDKESMDDRTETTTVPKKTESIYFLKHLENVAAIENSTVTLKCQLSTNSNSQMVSWVGPSEENLLGEKDLLMENVDGVLCLKLFKVSQKQAGIYKCEVRGDQYVVVTSCCLKIVPETVPKPNKKIVSPTGKEFPYKVLQASQEIKSTSCLNNPIESSESIFWSGAFEEKFDLLQVIQRRKISILQECLERSSKSKFLVKCYNKMSRSKDEVHREAICSHSTSHSCFVRALRLFETSNSLLILFPHFQHETKLFDYISNLYSFKESQAINLASQLFSALTHLHKRNIAHLRIKPETLQVDLTMPSEPLLKLFDFSDAKRLDVDPPQFQPSEDDPEFTPPEIFHNLPATVHCDVWNGAVTLYALLAGSTPFQDDSREVVRRKTISLSYDFPPDLFSDINSLTVSLISSVLVMPPNQRPTAQSCLEKCNYLKSFPNGALIAKASLVEFVKRRGCMQMQML